MSNMIDDLIKKSVVELFGEDKCGDSVTIEQTKKSFIGDITIICFPLVKWSKSSPENTAKIIGDHLLSKETCFQDYNIVKGFLNLTIKKSFWLYQFKRWYENKELGCISNDSAKLFMVEYSSPNTNKPLHLGHVRNIFLGDSIVSLYKAIGYKAIRTQIINDRGIHICKSMVAWQKYANGDSPKKSSLKGDHFVGKYYVLFDKTYKSEVQDLIHHGYKENEAKNNAPIMLEAKKMLIDWENGDPQVRKLWTKMNNWVYDGFSETYLNLGVDFDRLYYESETYKVGKEVVLKGLEEGIFYKKKDNSVWCDLSTENLDDKLLIRSDGTTVYMTQDIGTAVQRFKDFPKLSGIIYTVGNEQNHHFKVLFKILEKLGFSWSLNCHHLSYGMVELPDGKMKSREGTVVDADDLLLSVTEEARKMTEQRGHLEGMNDEEITNLCKKIGKAGLKYFLLKVDPKKNMTFNPKESIDLNGNTGPYIQYGYARINSLLNNISEIGDFDENSLDISEKELELIKLILDFNRILTASAKEYAPSVLANYLFNIVKSYNSFYQEHPIIKEENTYLRNLRLQISLLTLKIIKKGMGILGCEMPERM